MFNFKGEKLNGKWSVGDFTVSNKSRTIQGVSAKEDLGLFQTIQQIETFFGKSMAEMETLQSEIRKKRLDIKERTKSLHNDPESESTFHNIDVTLLAQQMRVLESKAKAWQDKFKMIREEKKLYKEATPTTQIVNQVEQTNSPLGISTPNTNPNVFKGFVNPNNVVAPTSPSNIGPNVTQTEKLAEVVSDAPVTQENTAPIDIDEKELAKSISVATSNREEVVVTTDQLGRPLRTNLTMEDDRSRLVAERVQNEEHVFNQLPSAQNLDFELSMNALKNRYKTKNRCMVISALDGKYWMEETEINADGIEVPNDTFIPPSINHIGELSFNPRKKLVKTQYDDDTIPFKIVQNSDSMPSFYISQWQEPAKNKYIIEPEQIETLSI